MATIQVKLKNGEIVPMSHPDDWSTQQIENAIHENFPDDEKSDEPKSEIAETPFNGRSAPEPESTGVKGLGLDALDLFSNAISQGQKFLKDIPNNAEKIIKDYKNNPLKAELHQASQIGAGAAESVKGLVNLPHDALKYLIRKHLAVDVPLPKGSNGLLANFGKTGNEPDYNLSDLIPHIPEDTGAEKLLGTNPNPERGDDLSRHTFDLISGGAAIKSLVNLASAPSKAKRLARVLEDKRDLAKKEHLAAKEEVKDYQNNVKERYSNEFKERLGEATPTALKENINVKSQKIEDLKPATEIAERKIEEIPPKPDAQALIKNDLDNAEKARKALMDEELEVKNNPTHAAGAKFQKIINDVKDSSSNLYNKARKFYEDKAVKANNTAEIKEVTKTLDDLKKADDLAPGYGSGSDVQKALEYHLKALQNETVDAKDIFDLQATLETMAKNTRAKQFAVRPEGQKLTTHEFDKLGELAQRFDHKANVLKKQLESVGGDEVQSIMKEANKGWKIYSDVKRNTTGRPIYKKGKLNPGALEELGYKEAGNEFLNALIKNDPKLRKQVLAAFVGESDSGVNKLLNPNSLTEAYLKSLPKVETKLKAYQTALQDVEKGKVAAKDEITRHKELVTSINEAAAEQKIRADAIKKTEIINKQIKFHKDEIPKIEEKIKIARSKGENVSHLEAKIKEHKRAIEDKGSLLKKAANTIVRIKGIQGITNTVLGGSNSHH